MGPLQRNCGPGGYKDAGIRGPPFQRATVGTLILRERVSGAHSSLGLELFSPPLCIQCSVHIVPQLISGVQYSFRYSGKSKATEGLPHSLGSSPTILTLTAKPRDLLIVEAIIPPSPPYPRPSGKPLICTVPPCIYSCLPLVHPCSLLGLFPVHSETLTL